MIAHLGIGCRNPDCLYSADTIRRAESKKHDPQDSWMSALAPRASLTKPTVADVT